MHEVLSDLVCTARSFGTHCCFITQNVVTAVHDAQALKVLHTNAPLSLSLRGGSSACESIKPFLPVTGRRLRGTSSPFEGPQFYTLAEERAIVFEEIANLPDRTGWLLLKGKATEAILLRTRSLDIPQGTDLENATLALRRNSNIGMRRSREEYERLIAVRDRKRSTNNGEDLPMKLQRAYQPFRGEGT